MTNARTRCRPFANWTVSILLALAVIATVPGSVQAQTGPEPVAVGPVVQQEVSSGQAFVGTVVPLRTSTVGGAVEGRVVGFFVNEGDRVSADQPLAQLRTETLKIEIASARAKLRLQQQILAELENGSRPQEIDQTRARMLAAKALSEYWAAKLKRTRTVYERGSATEEELQETVSSAVKAEQDYNDAQAALELAEEGPRAERIEQARASIAVQEEEVRRLEDQLEKHTIRAPFDGYVVAEHTELGQWLSAGDPVVEVAELDKVDVEVPVLEDYVHSIEVGMSARVEIGAIPDTAFTGEVALIVPRADIRARRFPVKVRLSNVQSGGSVLVKAGMFARVTFAVGSRGMALFVHKDALVLGGPSPVVFVLDPDPKQPEHGTVRPVPVELGVAAGDLIEVKGALEPGQQVVVEGNERLLPGQAVLVTRVVDPDGKKRPEVGALPGAQEPAASGAAQ
jgi:RND family efflux transporter MFP subunit